MLFRSVSLPPLNIGDSLAIRPAGAYNNTQWMQFIQYRPAVVLVALDGSVSVIRAAETLETVVAPERMPEALRQPFPQGLPA